jgi:acetoacetyl-CoA synthetase
VAADVHTGQQLWTPPGRTGQAGGADGRIGAYLRWLSEHRGLRFDDYPTLWQWSVDDLPGFWSSVADHFGIDGLTGRHGADVLADARMPGACWFPGARVNYAATMFAGLADLPVDREVVVGVSQTRPRVALTRAGLAAAVANTQAGLRRLGVGRGDVVAAYLPNVPETLVLLLAAAGLGAVFSSCAPEFGPASVRDRWAQLRPKLLVAADGYVYGHRRVDRLGELAELVGPTPLLPAVEHVVLLPYLDPAAAAAVGYPSWAEVFGPLGAPPRPGVAEPTFEPVPFDHPLYVLFSSGTTGLPKPIVHGHGGITCEHLKALALHLDLGPGDVFFWYSTTGWMMWNFNVSGLGVGATVLLFDGDPGWPDLTALWRLAADEHIDFVGTSAPFLMACRKAGLRPRELVDCAGITGIGSTGAPLPASGYEWVYDAVNPQTLLQSFSGGTDVCTGFLGGSRLLPVWAGEISCRCLGAKVEAFDGAGRPVIGREGELVLTAPLPSMPVGLWGDADGTAYRQAYFDTYPGVWRHGDWLTITERGSCVVSGRSDATLNRGGVRLGTAEFYAAVETMPEVADSLVIHVRPGGGEAGGWQADELLLFVVPADGLTWDAACSALVAERLRHQLSPRHVPDRVVPVAAIPRTLSGKKLEVPVKRMLAGVPADQAASAGALVDPAALAAFAAFAADYRRAHEQTGGERPDG